MRHLASAQYWDRPAGGDTGRLFLAFGGLVCANRISNCPLDRINKMTDYCLWIVPRRGISCRSLLIFGCGWGQKWADFIRA